MSSDRLIRTAALLVALFALAACSPERDESSLFSPQDVDVLVIDAVLMVGQPLPSLWLTRTLPPDVPYTLELAGESGATIVITGGGVTVPYYYRANTSPGYYTPDVDGTAPLVLPETQYSLSVVTDRGEELSAVTWTPARLIVENWQILDPVTGAYVRDLVSFDEADEDSIYNSPANQLIYAEGIVEAVVPAEAATAFMGSGYQIAIFSLDWNSDYVIDPPFLDDEDLADLPRSISSPVINGEGGSLRLPWISIYYEGRHKYKTYVIDLNWYDLLRSSGLQSGGPGAGGSLGDGVERPIFNVEGGIGLFGSGSVDSVGFRVHPTP